MPLLVSIFTKSHNLLFDTDGHPIINDTTFNVNAKEIRYLDFIEDWYFNPKTLSIQKKVKAIMPYIVQYDAKSGNYHKRRALFYLEFND